MKYASNLPEWQKDVVKFLSSHRKYRIFGWEFGPTLLDYLYKVKENKQPDYTKNGLIVTYSIVPVVALISFASTRRATFTAAATLGVMLFGVLITVAIDYQKTKRENNSEEEYCLGLLEALDETPKYWWWPWGKKIKDVEITEKEIERAVDYSSYSLISRLFYSLFTNVALHQLYVARLNYLYNYQKLGGEVSMKEEAKKIAKTGLKMAYSKFPEGAQDLWDKHAPSPLQVKEGLTMGEEAIEKEASGLEFKSDNLIRKLFNIDEASITLRKALSVFEKEWILLYLDRSLEEVRRGTKTEEQHNQYFSSIRNKDILKLSLDHHSDRKADKQEEGVEGNQRIINDLKEALKNIHNYVIENKSIHENRVVYRLFEDVPVKDIVNQDAFKVANTVANCELSSLAFWEGETLMKERNKYLNNVRSYLTILKIQGDYQGKIKKRLEEGYNKYKDLYEREWVKNLQELNKRCMNLKELEKIKSDVGKCLEESKEQYEILKNRKLVKKETDRLFVQPILEYYVLMSIYLNVFGDIGRENINTYYDEQSSIDEQKKENIEKLSSQELLESAQSVYGNLKGWHWSLKEDRKKELGKELFFTLERAAKLLEEQFKEKETLMEREGKRERVERKERREKLEKIENETKGAQERTEQEIQRAEQEAQRAEQEAQRAEQEAQARQSAEQRAKQLEQALEQKNLEKVAVRACNRKLAKLDDELQDAINEESENKIVEAAVGCARGSPEQVVDAIIEEIKINREQIIKEGKVSAEIIEAGIRSFSNHGTSLSDVNVSHGVNAGMGRNSGAGT